MMKRTHEAFSGVFWLGGTLCINLVAYRAGSSMPVNPAIALAGTFLAVPFSAGKNSPDIDHIWAPGPPRNYHWKYHRGFTHRFWFASLLTIPFLILFTLTMRTGVATLAPFILALPAGWWSHLFGDMIYGRLRIFGRPYGLGWTTGGLSETGKRKNGGNRIVIDPAAKVCTALAISLAACHLFLFATFIGS